MGGHYTAGVPICTHRWLGIAFACLSILWFFSAIVMRFTGVQPLDSNERLARLPAIVTAAIRVNPPSIGGDVERFSVISVEGRPVYRITVEGLITRIFADTGGAVPRVSADQALTFAWRWGPTTVPTREQCLRLAGGPMSTGDLPAGRIRGVIDAFRPRLPNEVDIVRFRGHYYASAKEGVVAFDEPYLGARAQLPADLIVGAARVLMPGVPIAGMRWMDEYDNYYYDRTRRKSLPVFRIRYDDPRRTWLYVDPRHGTIARKEDRLSRINRWLYPGFGGIVLSATAFATGWWLVNRRTRRVTARPT